MYPKRLKAFMGLKGAFMIKSCEVRLEGRQKASRMKLWRQRGLVRSVSVMNKKLYHKALRTHISRLLGPKTILYTAFGLF